MKSINILYLSVVLLCIACSPKSTHVMATDTSKTTETEKSTSELSSQISYEEIITKLNDTNIAKKSNLRTKEIIKEYTYNVGDDDSRNDARTKALNQVKVLILEETGVFVESYLEIDSITDVASRQYVREEIRSLTAGIIKTQILEERFDGKAFYIKASVLVDPDSVSEGISEVLKIRANQDEISNLQVLLNSKENELDMRSRETIELQKKLTAQELVNTAKESELKDLNRQVAALNTKLSQYQAEENKIQGELRVVQAKIDQAVSRIDKETSKARLIKGRMTKREVLNAIGNPTGTRSSDYPYHPCPSAMLTPSCSDWYYGKVKINFDNAGLVNGVSGGY